MPRQGSTSLLLKLYQKIFYLIHFIDVCHSQYYYSISRAMAAHASASARA